MSTGNEYNQVVITGSDYRVITEVQGVDGQ